jgi:stage II sporulation protein D
MLLLTAMLVALGTTARGFTPTVTTLRIGLFYGSSALPSANLQNVDNYGNGYEFGYFDDDRNFVSLGATTSETKISVMRDRNMTYTSGGYVPGSTGDAVVGCYHVQISGEYPDYYGARVAADQYDGAFIKYDNGVFRVMVGDYISATDAQNALSSRGLNGTITSGTTSTIAVAATGTGRVIFEFDGGAARGLGVMPVSSTGAKCQTWCKGYRYYGGFQYTRRDGGDLTVLSMVNIEDYVKGLLPYEMAPNWPLEALKAQALCARTYAASKLGAHKGDGFDLCTTEHCQVYHGTGNANETTNRAVDETTGLYITYNGELCETYYSSSDGGATESSENVWALARPYLRGVIDPYEVAAAGDIPRYYWTVKYTPDELAARLRSRGYNCSAISSLSVEYTAIGNVYRVTLRDTNGSKFTFTKGDSIRSVLGVRSIRFAVGGASIPGATDEVYINGESGILAGGTSSSYAIGADGTPQLIQGGSVYAVTGDGDIEAIGKRDTTGSSDGKVNGVFVISGAGNGHNVGMSQWGAFAMDKYHNKTYDEIIRFYFTGVEITG